MARIDFEPRWMASRTARGSRSEGWWRWCGIGMGSPSDRDWEAEEREKTNPLREWHFGRRDATRRDATRRDAMRRDASRTAWRRGAMRRGRTICDTRGDRNGGGKTNLRLVGANDVSTVRPTGAITSGILQSLRLSIPSPESLVRLSPSRFKNDHDMYTCIRV